MVLSLHLKRSTDVPRKGKGYNISVVDPNKLYLDPDLEFWPKLDLDPGIVINFEGQMVKIVLEENIFSL